ncbi:MAG: relaxasome subunit MobC [Lachnospiraceae bacterium]|nr:relaxasome subunit MobC [Lachnospiraceae bacterium]
MARKTIDERIEENIRKQEQLKARERDLKKRKSEEDRKRRTRRLIEIGGIAESVLGREFSEEDKIRFMNFLKKQETNGKYFSKAMNEVAG